MEYQKEFIFIHFETNGLLGRVFISLEKMDYWVEFLFRWKMKLRK